MCGSRRQHVTRCSEVKHTHTHQRKTWCGAIPYKGITAQGFGIPSLSIGSKGLTHREQAREFGAEGREALLNRCQLHCTAAAAAVGRRWRRSACGRGVTSHGSTSSACRPGRGSRGCWAGAGRVQQHVRGWGQGKAPAARPRGAGCWPCIGADGGWQHRRACLPEASTRRHAASSRPV